MEPKLPNPISREFLNLYSYLITGLGRHRVLAWGLADHGLLADVCAAQGAHVQGVDADSKRVAAAREGSKKRFDDLKDGRGVLADFFESVEGGERLIVSSPQRPVFNQSARAEFPEKFTVGDFDIILAPLTLATDRELSGALSLAHRLLHTDGLLAAALPHPCFAMEKAQYFAGLSKLATSGADEIETTGRIVQESPDGVPGLIDAPVYHRTITSIVDVAEVPGFQLRRIAESPASGDIPAMMLMEFGKDKWAP